MIFDERLERAIHILYISMDPTEKQTVLDLLHELVDEGNGDAAYVLGRCFCGEYYVDPCFNFPVDEESARHYFTLALQLNSPLAAVGCRRISIRDELPMPEKEKMQEALAVLKGYADQGHPFCQMMMGNLYYYADYLYIYGVERYPRETYRKYTQMAAYYYNCAIYGGIIFSAMNYLKIVTSGEDGIAVDPEKANFLYNVLTAGDYYMNKELYKPTKVNQYNADQDDLAFAAYSPSARFNNPFSCALLGRLYFRGGRTIRKDYDKAFQYFQIATKAQTDIYPELGTCYLKGYGCEPDYEKAKACFEKMPNKILSTVGLAEMYAYGLGVPQDKEHAMKMLSEVNYSLQAAELLAKIKEEVRNSTDRSVLQQKFYYFYKKFRKWLTSV